MGVKSEIVRHTQELLSTHTALFSPNHKYYCKQMTLVLDEWKTALNANRPFGCSTIKIENYRKLLQHTKIFFLYMYKELSVIQSSP